MAIMVYGSALKKSEARKLLSWWRANHATAGAGEWEMRPNVARPKLWDVVRITSGQDWRCSCGASGYEAAGSRPLKECPTCNGPLA